MVASRVAILASGEGTTAEAFITAAVQVKTSVQAALVICNNQAAGVFERVAKLNKLHGLDIQTVLINSTTHPAATGETKVPGGQTAAEEAAIVEYIKLSGVDLVLLMGYMKRVGSNMVSEFGWRPEYTSPFQAMMLNTHPGLLPETKGLYGSHVQEHVIKNHLSHGGQTLHVVAEDYDDGPVVADHKVKVLPDDTPESLFDRVKVAEKQFLPLDVDKFIKNRLQYLKTKEAA